MQFLCQHLATVYSFRAITSLLSSNSKPSRNEGLYFHATSVLPTLRRYGDKARAYCAEVATHRGIRCPHHLLYVSESYRDN
jgi:hypothetical protein